MYRVLVVEDELIVRKGLIMTTPWDKYSCKIIGEAKNGKEGLDLALKFKPDIIFYSSLNCEKLISNISKEE